MSRKKAPAKNAEAATKPIGTAEAFFIESHFRLKDAATLAAELGVAEADVAEYLARLEAAGAEPARKERTAVERAGYAVDADKGVVVATQTSAMTADEDAGTSPFPHKRGPVTRPDPLERHKRAGDLIVQPPKKFFR